MFAFLGEIVRLKGYCRAYNAGIEFQYLLHHIIEQVRLIEVIQHLGCHIFYNSLHTNKYAIDALIGYLYPAFRILLRTVQESLARNIGNNKGNDSENGHNRQHDPERQPGM